MNVDADIPILLLQGSHAGDAQLASPSRGSERRASTERLGFPLFPFFPPFSVPPVPRFVPIRSRLPWERSLEPFPLSLSPPHVTPVVFKGVCGSEGF